AHSKGSSHFFFTGAGNAESAGSSSGAASVGALSLGAAAFFWTAVARGAVGWTGAAASWRTGRATGGASACGFSVSRGSWTTTGSAAAGAGAAVTGGVSATDGVTAAGAGRAGSGMGVVESRTGSGAWVKASLARACIRSTASVMTTPPANVVRQSPMRTLRETTILSVAGARSERRSGETRGTRAIRSVGTYAGIAAGIPSPGVAETTGAGGGVTLCLTLSFRFPTENDPPSDACNTEPLLCGPDHMPKTVKARCQSRGNLVR